MMYKLQRIECSLFDFLHFLESKGTQSNQNGELPERSISCSGIVPDDPAILS